MDYDKFIIQKINEFPVTLRPRSGADDRILQISLDGTQDIRHVKAKVTPPSLELHYTTRPDLSY